jgi:hypothetical protein
VVGHGPKGSCPAGSLPVMSVENEEEAKVLITLACTMSLSGSYIAQELVKEQTLENLEAFSDRLNKIYHTHIKNLPLTPDNLESK